MRRSRRPRSRGNFSIVKAFSPNSFSLCRGPDRPRISPAERGIAEMMVDLYRTFASPLSDRMLFRWHRMLLKGNRDIAVIGGYRSGSDPMQVVSGPLHRRKIHFEAPPSPRMPKEMKAFNAWFNETAPRQRK